jgi:hypothetical protein|tara:strand:- start:190 stop:375 length:186 start_codon:yes stop_codon:yes gene_type:complete
MFIFKYVSYVFSTQFGGREKKDHLREFVESIYYSINSYSYLLPPEYEEAKNGVTSVSQGYF